jgi:hypothetical protein
MDESYFHCILHPNLPYISSPLLGILTFPLHSLYYFQVVFFKILVSTCKRRHTYLFFFSGLFHLAWWHLVPCIFLYVIWFCSSLWLNNIPLYVYHYIYVYMYVSLDIYIIIYLYIYTFMYVIFQWASFNVAMGLGVWLSSREHAY